jgi:hypothetical protein
MNHLILKRNGAAGKRLVLGLRIAKSSAARLEVQKIKKDRRSKGQKIKRAEVQKDRRSIGEKFKRAEEQDRKLLRTPKLYVRGPDLLPFCPVLNFGIPWRFKTPTRTA